MNFKNTLKLIVLFMIFSLTTLIAKEWTIMVFINGDNNLDSFAFEDINELEAVGSNDNVNIIVQYDRLEANSQANWSTAKRFYLNQDSDLSSISSPELMDLGEVDSGDYNTVVDFVNWGKSNYASDKYALIIWDHGSGWQKKSLDGTNFHKMISSDETSGNEISVAEGDYENMLTDIKISLGKKLDFLGLDACLMAMWEVAFSSENYADFIAFSEETENGTGWKYDSLLTQFFATDKSSKELCKSAVLSSIDSVGSTLSCVNLSYIPILTEKINAFATNYKTDTSIDLEILTAHANTLAMDTDPYYKDLGLFFENLSFLVSQDVNTQWVSPVLDAFSNVIVLSKGLDTEYANYSESKGMTIFMPLNVIADDMSFYNNAAWSNQTDWNEFISRSFNLPEDEYEPDNSFEEAYFNENLIETNHSIHNNNDNDFVKISLKEGTEYSFETICGEYDTFITLFDENGVTIKENDDDGEGRCSKISYFSESTSIAYLKIKTYDNESIAIYSLKITEKERIDDYPNSIDNVEESDKLINDLTGNIEYNEDVDFLYLDVLANNKYTITTLDVNLDDTILSIYNSNGELVTENDDINTSSQNYMSQVVFTPSTSQRYYIAVKAYEDKEGAYKIQLEIENTCQNTNGGVEDCDGIDNDCDGSIDNNLQVPNSDNQEGICKKTKKVCDGINGWIEPDFSTIEDYEEKELTCDGIDNDCDGEVDNDLVAPNNVNQKGVCFESKQFCSGIEGWTESYLSIDNYSNLDDTNDDLDNNCDGQVDEGYVKTSDGCSYSNNSSSTLNLMFFMLLIFSIFRFSNLIYKKRKN